jgi:hypothetical protein
MANSSQPSEPLAREDILKTLKQILSVPARCVDWACNVQNRLVQIASERFKLLLLVLLMLCGFCGCLTVAFSYLAKFEVVQDSTAKEIAKQEPFQRYLYQLFKYVADPNALSGFGGVLVGCVGAYIAWQISRIERKAQQRERLYKFDNEPASVAKIDVLWKSWKKGGEFDQIAEEAEECFAKTCQKEHRNVLQLIHKYLDNASELANLLRDICKALSVSNSADSCKLRQNLESIKPALERTQRQIEAHESKGIWNSVLEIVREYRDDAHMILPEVKRITITVIKFLCSKNCQLNTSAFRAGLEGIPELANDQDFLNQCGLSELIEGFNPKLDATSPKLTAYSGRESIPSRDDLVETWVNDLETPLSKNPFGWGSLSDDELFDPTFKLPSFVVFDSTRPKKELNKEFIRKQKGVTIYGGQLQDRIFVARMLQLEWLVNRFVVFCIFPPEKNTTLSTFTDILYEIAQSCAETWLSFLAKYPKEFFGLSKSDSENVLQLIFWCENSSERRIERMMRYGFDSSSNIDSEELSKRMRVVDPENPTGKAGE